MKFGLIHYRAPGDTLEQFLDFAAETGFDVVELQCQDIWPDNANHPEREAERVRRLLEERSIKASALSTGNDFVLLDEEAVGQQIKRMARLSKLAVILGTQVLRTEGGVRKDTVPRPKEAEAIGECLKRCVEFAERDDTHLAVDNHGQVTNDPEVLIAALQWAGSPRAGANLDTGNFHWMGHSTEKCRHIYDVVAPYALHTHIKDCVGTSLDGKYCSTVHGEGDVDLSYAISALQRAGYTGPYIAEWEGAADEDNAVAYAKCLAWMRKNIKK